MKTSTARDPGAPPSCRWWIPGLLGVFLLALGIRLLFLWEIRFEPAAALLFVDSQGYDAWARRLAGGDWLGTGIFYQAPLYPYFLGGLYALLGPGLLTVRLVQILIGSLSCVALALAGGRFLDRRAGLVAGLLLAVNPTAVFSETLIQKSVLDILLVCLLLLALSRARGGTAVRPWFLTGLALGSLILTRENAVVFLPLIAALPLAEPRRPAAARPFRALIATALGIMLALAPVALRNKIVGGEFFLTTFQFGTNLHIGNNPHARGTYAPLRYGREDPLSEQHDARELAETARGRKLTPAEISAYWRDQALNFIRSAPGTWLRLMGRKVMLTLNSVEIPDAYDQYTYGDWSGLLRWLNRLFPFGLLLVLAAAGAALGGRERRELWPLAALFVLYASSVALFYVFARYRLPLAPLLMLFAARFLCAAPGRVRGGAARTLALPCAAAAAAAAITFWPLSDKRQFKAAMLTNTAGEFIFRMNRSADALPYLNEVLRLELDYAPDAYYNLGVAYRNLGRLEEGLAFLLRAVAQAPSDPNCYAHIGEIYRTQGQTAEAIAWYERGLRVDPRHPTLLLELGQARFEAGDRRGAIDAFERARAILPQDPGILGGLGLVYFDLGNFTEAARWLEEALRRDPNWSEAQRYLGLALMRLGQPAEAQRHLDEAVRLNPGSNEARASRRPTATSARRP